jgi:aminopeptidase N
MEPVRLLDIHFILWRSESPAASFAIVSQTFDAQRLVAFLPKIDLIMFICNRRAAWLSRLTCFLVLAMPVALLAQARPGPFTQPQRSVRSRAIDQLHVALDLQFDFDQQRIAGIATHSLALFQPARSIDLDAAGMKIEHVDLLPTDSASLASPQPLKFRHTGQTLTIDFDREHSAGTQLKLAIGYTINKPQRGAHFVVPDDDEPTQPRMVWTQSEPEYARYWFPCFDHPSDRLTSEIVATVPAGLDTLSNGTLDKRTENDGGTVTWHWRQVRSHVPYLLSIVAGDFEVLEQSWDGIPVQSYVPRGRLADASRSFEKTPAMLKLFTEKIGLRYPWPKYAQICVDEYGWGGMEHTSATTLNLGTLHDERAHLDVSSDNLVAHELAHQWWGDLLTCKDWGEIWLNESFATYFATLWTEHDRGWDEAAWERAGEANDYLGEDARYRRSIVNYRYNSPENVFDRHSYPKGGRVLHMLRFELGEEQFWRAIRRYAEVNQFRTVETADLRIAIEDATGQGMNWFFDQWVHRGGHPEFHVAWTWDAAAKQVKVTVKQTQKVDEVTPLFRTAAEIEIAPPSGEPIMRRVTLSKAEETFHFDAAERPARVCFDPRDWILKKLTSDKSREEWLDQLARDPNVAARAEAVRGLAAWKTDSEVIAALALAAKSDSFWGVRQEAVKTLGQASGDAARAALLAAAKDDPKSFVRRDALAALANFAHDESRAAARRAIEHDPSYYAVAEALKVLTKIDRAKARDVLLASLARESHQDVVLRAACDGLVELKDTAAAEQLSQMLNGPLTPGRRAAVIGCLARLKPGDPESLAHLHAQLKNDRSNIRRAAVETLATAGSVSSLDELAQLRQRETTPRMLSAIDEAQTKLRQRLSDSESLRTELEKIRQENENLRRRLDKLDQPAAK